MYEVPASKRSIKQNQFRFKIGAGEFSLPKFTMLSIGQLETIFTAQENDLGALLGVFGEPGSPVGKAVRDLDKDQLMGLIAAWRDDSGEAAGESQPS